jgi:hypothetical protein
VNNQTNCLIALENFEETLDLSRIYLAVPGLLEPESCTALKAASSSSPFSNSIARLFVLDPLIFRAAAAALASTSLKNKKYFDKKIYQRQP